MQILRRGAYIYKDAGRAANAVRGVENRSMAVRQRQKDGGHGKRGSVQMRDGIYAVCKERICVYPALGKLPGVGEREEKGVIICQKEN